MEVQTFIDRLSGLFDRFLQKLPEIALTVFAGYLAIKVIRLILHSAIRVTRANQAMKGILLSVVDIGLWTLLLATVMHEAGLTQLSFVLSGSVVIAGLAVSTGSTAFVQDLVSGLFLAQDPDFNVGQKVKVAEIEGVVEKMDARKVRLRDANGELHVYPNSTFDRSSWIVKNRK